MVCAIGLGRLAHPIDQLIGFAGHGGDHDGNVVACLDLTFYLLSGVAYALQIGDGCAAKFHNKY